MTLSRFRRFWTDRAGVTAVVFAVALPAMMLSVALAIDFGGAVVAKTQLDLAADTAAMTAATTASQMYVAGGYTSAQIQAAATTAGQNRLRATVASAKNKSRPNR
jgi:Flp pilus assembly protein TadG